MNKSLSNETYTDYISPPALRSHVTLASFHLKHHTLQAKRRRPSQKNLSLVCGNAFARSTKPRARYKCVDYAMESVNLDCPHDEKFALTERLNRTDAITNKFSAYKLGAEIIV